MVTCSGLGLIIARTPGRRLLCDTIVSELVCTVMVSQPTRCRLDGSFRSKASDPLSVLGWLAGMLRDRHPNPVDSLLTAKSRHALPVCLSVGARRVTLSPCKRLRFLLLGRGNDTAGVVLTS